MTAPISLAEARARYAVAAECGVQYALGARVAVLRRERGLSQRTLGLRAGIERPNIARIEAGRHMLTIDCVMRLARALEVQPSAILCVLDEVGG